MQGTVRPVHQATSAAGVLTTQQINETLINTVITALKSELCADANEPLFPVIDALKDCWLLELAKQERVSISQGILQERIARHAQVLKRDTQVHIKDQPLLEAGDKAINTASVQEVVQPKRKSRFRNLDGGAPNLGAPTGNASDPAEANSFVKALLVKDQCLPGEVPRNVICGKLQISTFRELNSLLDLTSNLDGPYHLENGFATLDGQTVYFHKCFLTRIGRAASAISPANKKDNEDHRDKKPVQDGATDSLKEEV